MMNMPKVVKQGILNHLPILLMVLHRHLLVQVMFHMLEQGKQHLHHLQVHLLLLCQI
jgi:hypothetical protein